MDGDPRVTQHAYRHSVGGIGKSNGLFHRPRPPTPCHPAAILPAAARAWGRPARPAPAAGQRRMPPAGRRLAPQRTDRMGGWGRAACTAGAARGKAAGGGMLSLLLSAMRGGVRGYAPDAPALRCGAGMGAAPAQPVFLLKPQIPCRLRLPATPRPVVHSANTEGCRPKIQCLRKPQLAHVKKSGASVKESSVNNLCKYHL